MEARKDHDVPSHIDATHFDTHFSRKGGISMTDEELFKWATEAKVPLQQWATEVINHPERPKLLLELLGPDKGEWLKRWYPVSGQTALSQALATKDSRTQAMHPKERKVVDLCVEAARRINITAAGFGAFARQPKSSPMRYRLCTYLLLDALVDLQADEHGFFSRLLDSSEPSVPSSASTTSGRGRTVAVAVDRERRADSLESKAHPSKQTPQTSRKARGANEMPGGRYSKVTAQPRTSRRTANGKITTIPKRAMRSMAGTAALAGAIKPTSSGPKVKVTFEEPIAGNSPQQSSKKMKDGAFVDEPQQKQQFVPRGSARPARKRQWVLPDAEVSDEDDDAHAHEASMAKRPKLDERPGKATAPGLHGAENDDMGGPAKLQAATPQAETGSQLEDSIAAGLQKEHHGLSEGRAQQPPDDEDVAGDEQAMSDAHSSEEPIGPLDAELSESGSIADHVSEEESGGADSMQRRIEVFRKADEEFYARKAAEAEAKAEDALKSMRG